MKLLSLSFGLAATMAGTAAGQAILQPRTSLGAVPSAPVTSAGMPANTQFPNAPGFRNASGLSLSNLVTGGFDASQAGAVLMQLQASIEQALPVVAALSSLNASPGVSSGQSLGRFSGTDRFGNPLPASPVTGGRPLAADATRSGALSPTGTTNAAGSAAFPADLAAMQNNISAQRSFIVLQSDLERALALLTGLNGMPVGSLGSGVSVTNTTPGSGSLVPGASAVNPASNPTGR